MNDLMADLKAKLKDRGGEGSARADAGSEMGELKESDNPRFNALIGKIRGCTEEIGLIDENNERLKDLGDRLKKTVSPEKEKGRPG